MDDSKRRDSNASDKSEEGDSKRTNQFSFVERATQTMNNALKVNINTNIYSYNVAGKLSRIDIISQNLTCLIISMLLPEQRHADGAAAQGKFLRDGEPVGHLRQLRGLRDRQGGGRGEGDEEGAEGGEVHEEEAAGDPQGELQ